MFALIIILIMLVLSYIYIEYSYKQKKEGLNETNGRYCPTCKGKGIGSCLECINCGLAVNERQQQCVEGDLHGPYSAKIKPDQWIQNQTFRIFNEDIYPKWQFNYNLLS